MDVYLWGVEISGAIALPASSQAAHLLASLVATSSPARPLSTSKYLVSPILFWKRYDFYMNTIGGWNGCYTAIFGTGSRGGHRVLTYHGRIPKRMAPTPSHRSSQEGLMIYDVLLYQCSLKCPMSFTYAKTIKFVWMGGNNTFPFLLALNAKDF